MLGGARIHCFGELVAGSYAGGEAAGPTHVIPTHTIGVQNPLTFGRGRGVQLRGGKGMVPGDVGGHGVAGEARGGGPRGTKEGFGGSCTSCVL